MYTFILRLQRSGKACILSYESETFLFFPAILFHLQTWAETKEEGRRGAGGGMALIRLLTEYLAD